MKQTANPCFTLPAEWQEQSGVLLIWPDELTDWAPYLDDIRRMYVAMADAITRHERIVMVCRDVTEAQKALADKLTAQQMESVTWIRAEYNDTWARDVAPLTLLSTSDEEGANEAFRLTDFCFNGWGEKFESAKDNRLNRELAQASLFGGELVEQKDFVLEGGSIESDGKGTLFTTADCLLAPHRNQPLSQESIEAELKKRLGMKRVIWLQCAPLPGDDTDGHIDTLVRTAPNDTLLYVGCGEDEDKQHHGLLRLERQLCALRTAEGKPYRLLRLPMPHAIVEKGEQLPATYANFLVINGAVLVPVYGQKEADSKAISIVQEAFPDREMIAIEALAAIRQHGSVHCLSMQFPQGALRQNARQ